VGRQSARLVLGKMVAADTAAAPDKILRRDNVVIMLSSLILFWRGA
jgi:hypothetical protein